MIDRYILLAEDNDNDAELTITALRESKIIGTIQRVLDGADTLDFLYKRGAHAARSDGPPALILLDLKMPKVDGLEVLKTIKNDRALRTIPVVMLTSSREETDLARCYEYGANAYVVKPVNYDDFMRAVRDVGMFWGLINEPAPAPPNAPGQRESP